MVDFYGKLVGKYTDRPMGSYENYPFGIFTLTCKVGPTSYKWSYSPYKWPYKWVTGVITPISGVITPFITGRGPTLWNGLNLLINPIRGYYITHLGWTQT